MKPSQGIINQFAQTLLQKPSYAWFLTGVFALFPFTDWIALAVMSLITLRLGWFHGMRCLIAGMTVSICLAEFFGQLPDVLSTAAPAYLLCYFSSELLRRSANWQWVALLNVFSAILLVVGVHYFAPDYLMVQYQSLIQVLNQVDQSDLIAKALGHTDITHQSRLAYYFFSIKLLGVLLSVVISLALARSIQSALYYPGGFKQEMLNFRASSIGLFLLLLTAIGAYHHDLLSIGCAPIFFVYLMVAGLSLICSMMAKKKKLLVYVVVFLPMVVLPYIVFPIYVLFGSIDSVFNLRSRWSKISK